ncbi:sodium-dependent bicarbonate transport family permease [Sulfurihydrogenibium sp.]|uniref:sodium-dependent bicarbonate transport family permease n=1 Tax=Sulfurihydrogenibium sp. TaxID=2053621 RepID=UPI00261F2543|nr:sodium-dependent bicarbonate transport family permease [Sulfurihydrogenibium sp.]
MSVDLLLQNVLNPPILFFFLGVLSVFLRTGLDIPQPLPKFFSLYLLIAIGLHGGYELAKSGIDSYVLKVLLLAMLMAILVPIYAFFILRIKLDVFNAVAIAATYGSISAVTFITASNFLQSLGENYGGYMVAAMTLMESPAIVIGLILLSLFAKREENEKLEWREVIRESFFNPSVYLLIGALMIGFITGEKGWKVVDPLFGQLFKPMLAFFLLDMGIVAARRLGDLKKVGWFLIAFAVFIPILNAVVAILIGSFVGMSKGDAFMFAVLCASASYIAVPAAMRLSVPEANPSIYVTMALAVTFPFNISVGLPFYYWLLNYIWGV